MHDTHGERVMNYKADVAFVDSETESCFAHFSKLQHRTKNITNSSTDDLYRPFAPLPMQQILVVVLPLRVVHARLDLARALFLEALCNAFGIL